MSGRLKSFGLPLIFGTALTLLSPALSFGRDRDRDRHEWREERREHERHEGREREFRERRFRGYGGPSYSNGYYDQWGHWHPYAQGYYDRWGNWHPYGY